jgi:predicted amidohydrolase YtcJ
MKQTSYVLYNGKIVTLDDASSIQSALLISGERIAAVGDDKSVLAIAPSDATRIDLQGQTVIPGFFDGHAHMDREGLKAYGGLSLSGLRSIAQIKDTIREAAKKAKPGEWIVCMPLGDPPYGYFNNPSQLLDGRFPTRYDLDEAAPNNPVYIRGVWAWWGTPPYPSIANSLALREVGVCRDTPAPNNVTIEKDESGELTGIFLDRNRAPVLEYSLFPKIPRFTFEDRVNSIRDGSAIYCALGTTSCYEGHGLTPAVQRAYTYVASAKDLRVRVNAPVSLPSPAKSTAEILDLLYHYAGLGSGEGAHVGRFGMNGVVLDPGDPTIASLFAAQYPYEQWAGFFFQALSADEFVEIGVAAAKLGMRISTPLVDVPPFYSLEKTLSLLERVNSIVPIANMRCVAMHLTKATDDQLDRIKKLGLCVTMTTAFLHHHSAAFKLSGMGDDAIPIRRVIDKGIPLAFSTDNVPPSMLFTLWESLARWDNSTLRKEGNSHLTREEALRVACQSGHYITWDEASRGTIAAGYFADLAVIDGDILACDLDLIPNLNVSMTFLEGELVHKVEEICPNT